MKSIYQKIVYFVMIIAFSWVIVGDLVNMHIRLIYKKDIATHNVYYVKTVKKDKSDHKFNLKKILNGNILFFDLVSDNQKIILPSNKILFSYKNEKSDSKLNIYSQLRAPPAL